MKATDFRGQPTDIPLQTVSLSRSHKDPYATYIFRCYRCGDAISKIQGDVISIVSGLVPTSSVTVINQCDKCKENYTFQTVPARDKKEIRLILSPQEGKNLSSFMCVICRSELLKYNEHSITLTPWMTLGHLPCDFICFNPTCNRHYHLEDIVSLGV